MGDRNENIQATREPSPWERQATESAAAFAAFAEYRDQGPSRSLKKTARELGKATSGIEKWSSKNAWRERTNAFDEYLDRVRQEARMAALLRAAEREETIVDRLQSALLQRLDGDEAADIAPLDPHDLDWKDVVRLSRLVGITPERRGGMLGRRIPIDEAIAHHKTLVGLARKYLTEELFDAFINEYRSRYDPTDDADAT